MSNERAYTIAGTSVLNGKLTYRFATGAATARAKLLERNGHTDVKLFDLPEAMTKVAAVAYMETQGISAVLPVTGRTKAAPVVLTPEEQAAAEAAVAAALAAQTAAAEAAAAVAAADADYIANLAEGGEPVDESTDVTPTTAGTEVPVDDETEALLAVLGDTEVGVDADREEAAAEAVTA